MNKKVEDYVRSIPDFPEPGIIFRDVTSVIQSPEGLKLAIDGLTDLIGDTEFDVVVGPESRGFIFGVPVAYNTGKGFVPVRKKGKLPCETISADYELEYGTATIEMHKDAITPGQKVIIVDDLIATGGTTEAIIKLVEELGGEVVKVLFLMELEGLKGRDFEVDVESFEELLPGKIVSSYATGNRDIENSFIMFRVCNVIKDIQYFPVFSETVGRKMLKSWNKPVPKKRSIFIEDNNGVGRGNGGTGNGNKNNVENSKLRSLILFARSLMILHINDPQPMNGMLKEIYEKLELHPYWNVRNYEVKAVNTAIGSFLRKDINVQNENFQNLHDYILYLQTNVTGRRIRNTNFDTLRNIMRTEYPAEQVYF